MGTQNSFAGSAGTASIGDFVWDDLNKDGIQDAGEPGVAGVSVRLFDGIFNSLSGTTTDANGFYFFGSLDAGDYNIGVSLPAGFTFTLLGAGSDDALDSNIGPLAGVTLSSFPLANAQFEDTIDAGLISSIPEEPIQVIGGEIIPLNTTALLLAGAQTFSWMIPVVLSVLGIGLFVVTRKNE